MTEAVTDFGAAWGRTELEPPAPTARAYQHYRPFAEAADEFVREAQQGRRFYLGVPALDMEMRGISAGHLCLINGFTHSGKTLVAFHALRKNRDKRVLLLIPDEPRPLVLAKLASAQSGVSASELEFKVEQGDRDAIRLLKETATQEFPNLIVMDKPLTANVMEDGLKEAQDVWGADADCVMLDYVELLSAGETVQSKFDFIKGYGTRHNLPLIALHQTSRSAGAEGRAMTISSGSYGGEQHATFVLGVRRKLAALVAEIADLRVRILRGAKNPDELQNRLDTAEAELRVHEFTLTVNLVKCKRPGGGLVDEIDFELDTETGRIVPMEPGDLPSAYRRQFPQRQQATPQEWRQEQF